MTRLTSRFLVDLLLRRTAAAGGFAAILASGDERVGTILVQCRDRGVAGPLLERRFAPNSGHMWETIGPADTSESARAAYCERRRKADPDLWIVELDIAEAPRLVAEWGELS